jgi:hypothetical protein
MSAICVFDSDFRSCEHAATEWQSKVTAIKPEKNFLILGVGSCGKAGGKQDWDEQTSQLFARSLSRNSNDTVVSALLALNPQLLYVYPR